MARPRELEGALAYMQTELRDQMFCKMSSVFSQGRSCFTVRVRDERKKPAPSAGEHKFVSRPHIWSMQIACKISLESYTFWGKM
jgi:hypothetical protein